MLIKTYVCRQDEVKKQKCFQIENSTTGLKN